MTEPIVFLPGMMCDARLFAPQLDALSRERAIMVAPTCVGDRIEEIASNVLTSAPAKFALAGLSMGGIVAMEVYRRAPERVTRIALMSTNPMAELPDRAAAREPQIVKVKAGRLPEVMADEMKPQYLAQGPYRQEILNLCMDMAEALGPDVFIRQSRALQRRRDQQATLRKIKCPALVLCGEHDQLCPPERHQFMAELIPYSIFKVIGGAGHLPTLEQATVVNDLMREWLRQPLVLQ
ncbi:MAG: alpha/beta fold hydrolase [Rhodobacteraceae bacterium]|nr:alpha/beta fold hydrolase [Paracoccaceae bacterium]